jgi:hypothetical protein
MFAILRIFGLPFKIDSESLSRAAVERFAAAVHGKHSILPKGRIDVVNRLKPIVPVESQRFFVSSASTTLGGTQSTVLDVCYNYSSAQLNPRRDQELWPSRIFSVTATVRALLRLAVSACFRDKLACLPLQTA